MKNYSTVLNKPYIIMKGNIESYEFYKKLEEYLKKELKEYSVDAKYYEDEPLSLVPADTIRKMILSSKADSVIFIEQTEKGIDKYYHDSATYSISLCTQDNDCFWKALLKLTGFQDIADGAKDSARILIGSLLKANLLQVKKGALQ